MPCADHVFFGGEMERYRCLEYENFTPVGAAAIPISNTAIQAWMLSLNPWAWPTPKLGARL
jgi:hypothetical protein